MNTNFLTTAEAARRARVSRPTISRALKSGDLEAMRDNSGMWNITPEAVDAWAKSRSPVQHEQRLHSVQNTADERAERIAAELSEARTALARAEGETAELRGRLAGAEALADERARALAAAERNLDDLRRMLPPPAAAPALKPGRPWWRFWE